MSPAIPSGHGVPTRRSSQAPGALVTARTVRVIGWAAVAAFVLGRPAWALPSPDVVVTLVASAAQVLGLLTVVGATIALWNAVLVGGGARSAWAKIGSLLPALALLYLVWFSFAFHLISLRLN